MNEVPDVVLAHVDRLARRVTLLGVLLALTGVLVVGIGAWNRNQARALRGAREQAARLRTQVDSLIAAQAAAARRQAQDGERLRAVEERTERTPAGVRRAEVAAVRDWVSRVESQVDLVQNRLEALSGDVDRRLVTMWDSLGALQARLRATVDSGLTGEAHSRALLTDRVAALDRRVDAMAERQNRLGWRRAARDVLGIASLGILLPHVLDHADR